jgi:hypothetical protein
MTIGTKPRFVRARINLAPTQQAKQRIVGEGFTPSRTGCKYLETAQFRSSYAMLPLPGTYALVSYASIKKPVTIGKLGTIFLEPGFYVYIGSEKSLDKFIIGDIH